MQDFHGVFGVKNFIHLGWSRWLTWMEIDLGSLHGSPVDAPKKHLRDIDVFVSVYGTFLNFGPLDCLWLFMSCSSLYTTQRQTSFLTWVLFNNKRWSDFGKGFPPHFLPRSRTATTESWWRVRISQFYVSCSSVAEVKEGEIFSEWIIDVSLSPSRWWKRQEICKNDMTPTRIPCWLVKALSHSPRNKESQGCGQFDFEFA